MHDQLHSGRWRRVRMKLGLRLCRGGMKIKFILTTEFNKGDGSDDGSGSAKWNNLLCYGYANADKFSLVRGSIFDNTAMSYFTYSKQNAFGSMTSKSKLQSLSLSIAIEVTSRDRWKTIDASIRLGESFVPIVEYNMSSPIYLATIIWT